MSEATQDGCAGCVKRVAASYSDVACSGFVLVGGAIVRPLDGCDDYEERPPTKQQQMADDGYCCTCFQSAPCGFCMAWTEEDG